MKLSDYVMHFVARQGVRHVFMLPGGGAMHLNDSLGKEKGVQFVCCLHEQACAIAAEAYAKVTGNLGVVLVTSGPGATNAVTGLVGAWLDSTPCLFLSGQAKRSDLIGDSGVRQMGNQEVDIISMVKPTTKYAVTVMDPQTIRFHLEKAVHLARAGRPGPAWIDIPLDVQAAEIDEGTLVAFEADRVREVLPAMELPGKVKRAIELVNAAERPVLLAGNGIRIAQGTSEFHAVVARLGIPVLTTWAGIDLMPDDAALFFGRPGAIAPRGANFILQNADCLISVGSRLDSATVGYSQNWFARGAKKIVVDVDRSEIGKLKMPVELPIEADARKFCEEFLGQASAVEARPRTAWLDRCREWKVKYPVVLPELRDRTTFVNSVAFSDLLSDALAPGDIIVPTSAGASIELVFLAFKIKEGQRMFHNHGTGAMGFALPSAVGACLAGGRRTVCIDADGGIQFNIQELQTISRLHLPIIIFVLSNRGYGSIRASQSRHFGRLVAADETSGMTLPDILKVAAAYGIEGERISDQSELADRIGHILARTGPYLCDVLIAPDELRAPCISSKVMPDGSLVSSPLEDLWPFLDRDEFLSNMIVPPVS